MPIRGLFISYEKGLSPAGNLKKKYVTAIIPGKVQGIVRGGENLFSLHIFFSFFSVFHFFFFNFQLFFNFF